MLSKVFLAAPVAYSYIVLVFFDACSPVIARAIFVNENSKAFLALKNCYSKNNE